MQCQPCFTKEPPQNFYWFTCENCKADFLLMRLTRIAGVLPILLLLLLCITACGPKHQGEAPQAAADAFSTSTHCQLQTVGPAPGYGPEVSLKTYLCGQFVPNCFISRLSSPAFDQVPAIVSNTCPQTVPFGQVPPAVGS